MSPPAQKPRPADTAGDYLTELAENLRDSDMPRELQQLGRTLRTWHHQIVAWHQAQISNGPTEATNNLIKMIKRVGFGFCRFRVVSRPCRTVDENESPRNGFPERGQVSWDSSACGAPDQRHLKART